MLTAPSPKAASLLRHLQFHALDSVFDEQRPVTVTNESFAGWHPPLPMDQGKQKRAVDETVKQITSAASDLPTEF